MTALHIAIVVLVVGLLAGTWAHVEVPRGPIPVELGRGEEVTIGLRTYTGYEYVEMVEHPLRELPRAYRGLAGEGLAVLICGIAAALAAAAASVLLRRRALREWGRIALAVPSLASVIATLAFVNGLVDFDHHELTWAPYACLLGALGALAALATPGRSFWAPR